MKNGFLSDLELFFMALADKTRLRLLNLMLDEEISVCHFAEALGESQPKISRHLAYLRNARLVETRRDGKWIYYRLIRPHNEYAATVLEDALNWLSSDKEIQEDNQRLAAIFHAEEQSILVNHISEPNTSAQANINHTKSKQSEQLEVFLL